MGSKISELAFIGEGVSLGTGVSIGPGSIILGPCTIEDNVWIGTGVQIGAPPEISSLPQNTAWAGELQYSGVIIKSGAVIREGAVIHQGSNRATSIGQETWILNRAYVAHDVNIGDNSVISAGVSIGGHCDIGHVVNVGLNASIHQRRYVGDGSMIGMGTPLARNVPAFAKVFGNPAKLRGINKVTLNKFGASEKDIYALDVFYQTGDYLSSEKIAPEVFQGFLELFGEWSDLEPKFAITNVQTK